MSKHFGLRENLTTLFRHKRSIVCVALFAGAASFGVSLLQSKQWESSARILVQQNRAQPRIGSTFSTGDSFPQLNGHDQVRTEVEIFLSPVVLQKAVNALGPELVLDQMRWRWDWLRDLPMDIYNGLRDALLKPFMDEGSGAPMTPEQLAMRKLSAHLAAMPVRETDVFAIGIVSPNPEFSARAVNTLLDAYLSRHIEIRQGALSSGVFAAETERLQADLREATMHLQKLKADTGVVSPATQKQLLLQRISDAEAALHAVDIDRVEARSRIAETRRQIARRPANVQLQSTVSRNPLIDALRTQLAELEAERAQYQPDSSAGRTLDRDIAQLRTRLRGEQEKVASSQISGPDNTYQEMERELALDQSKLSGTQSRVELGRQLDSYRKELARLDEIEAVMRELTRDVDLKEEALRISLKKQEEESLGSLLNRKHISDGTPIERAMVPDRPSGPRKWLNLGLGLGGGLVAGLMLAYLAEYFRRTFTTREEAEEQLGIQVLASFMDRNQGGPAATVNKIEARGLGESLLREQRDHGCTRFLFVSCHRGEGRSSTIDAVAAYLRGHGVAVTETDSAGQARIDAAAEPAASGLMLIEGGALSDANSEDIDMRRADRIILVIEAERTTGLRATGALRAIDAAGGKVLGVVLNRRRYFIPDWVYGWLLSPRQSMHA